MSPSFVRSIFVFVACAAALGASGCSSATRSAESSSDGPAPSASGSSSYGPSGSAGDGKLAPRYDLHCTPQKEGDEAACLAKGSNHQFGPPLICRGVQAPPDVRAAEQRAYEQATNPCTCISSEELTRCMMSP